jgi:hypothetical protein
MHWSRVVVQIATIVFLCIATATPSSAHVPTVQTYTQSRYRGPVVNTTYKIPSGIQMDLTINDTSDLSGRTTFIQLPQTLRLCGSGPITGHKTESTLQFQFISDDDRLGCTFTQGVTFIFTATLSADLSVLQGVYTTNSVPIQQGVFTTTLTFDSYLPITRR